MLFSDFTQEMLGIQDVKVKKVVQKETEVEICFEMRKKSKFARAVERKRMQYMTIGYKG